MYVYIIIDVVHHAHTLTYMHALLHTFIYIHTLTHSHIYTQIPSYTHILAHQPYTHTYTHLHTHTHTHTLLRTHTYMLLHTHTYMLLHTHTYILLHTHTLATHPCPVNKLMASLPKEARVKSSVSNFACFLLEEKQKGAASAYAMYLDCLPADFDGRCVCVCERVYVCVCVCLCVWVCMV
jgi:hypothetical protein